MERDGKLPEGTMRKAYDEEAAFDLGYGTAAEYVIANKAQIVNWWKGTADTQSGFEQDGAVIGETWDGPIFQLKNQGLPYNYMAPVEGALTWIDSIALTAGAANLEQAYAFINWAFQPEIGGDRLRQHRLQLGGEGLRAARQRAASRRTSPTPIPRTPIDKLWIQGTERPWFLEKRQALVDKISAA